MDQPKLIHKSAIKVIGIEVRTTNKDEANRDTAKIPLLWQRYFQENVREKIPNKVQPGHVLAVYTDYESDEHGRYTEIIGCEVSSLDTIPEGMMGKIIPQANYAVFLANGKQPEVIISTWQQIWNTKLERTYIGDFEVYDSQSTSKAEIYVAIK